MYTPKGTWKHRLSEKNTENRTAICSTCGPTRLSLKQYLINGKIKWGCITPRRLLNRKRYNPYRQYLKQCCEKCGFQPKDLCQLDVDHKDSNHKNDSPENLQTLCANCHRLKTIRPDLFA